MNLPPTQVFRYSFLISVYIFLAMTPFSFVIGFSLISILKAEAYFPLIIILANLLLTVVIAEHNRIYINLTGIRASNFWGKFVFVDWQSITVAMPFNMLGFNYLVVSSNQSPKMLWICLSLSDKSRFKRLVSEYVGASHIIARVLEEEFHNHSRLDRALNQIKNTWITSAVIGGSQLFIYTTLISSLNPDDFVFGKLVAAMFLIFSFGVYKKSRIASVALLAIYLINVSFPFRAFYLISLTEELGIIEQMFLLTSGTMFALIAALLIIHSIEGIKGTFAYHKLIHLERNVERS